MKCLKKIYQRSKITSTLSSNTSASFTRQTRTQKGTHFPHFPPFFRPQVHSDAEIGAEWNLRRRLLVLRTINMSRLIPWPLQGLRLTLDWPCDLVSDRSPNRAVCLCWRYCDLRFFRWLLIFVCIIRIYMFDIRLSSVGWFKK